MVRCVFRIFLAAACLLPLPGCLDDDFMDTMVRENAYYSFSVHEADTALSVYFPISDSGQAVMYRVGDDASYINSPSPISLSNSILGGGDVVLDSVTHLMWTKCSAIGGNTVDSGNCSAPKVAYAWQDAFDLCDDLTYAGEDDWRLPTMPEIFSILDFGKTELIDLTIFEANLLDRYWTSTILSGSYYYVDYSDPEQLANVENPVTANYLRCVRGPE